MKVTILCSSEDHPVNKWLHEFIAQNESDHQINIARATTEIGEGDVLFLVSCTQVIKSEDRAKFNRALVLHASELPLGRGWSPHIWQIIEGETKIIVSLLEAEAQVDSGSIVAQEIVFIKKTDLYNEINNALFFAEMNLMHFVLDNGVDVASRPQSDSVVPTYYRRGTPEDSQLDVNKSIKSQFDLIRVCDPDRYPAFIEIYGQRYQLTLKKMES